MAVYRIRCGFCGKPTDVGRKDARFCSASCRKRAHNQGVASKDLPEPDMPLVLAVHAKLAEAVDVDPVDQAIALALAARVADPTSTSVAANVKTLRQLMTEITGDEDLAEVVPIDPLAALRAEAGL